MFHENLRTIRKAKGLSQEEFCTRLHVVRQTISKWERGLSVPDAEMLIRIAEVLETSVSQLLGEKIFDESDRDNVAEQLARINEQLAIRNRRTRFILRLVIGIIATIIVFNILLLLVGMISFNSFQDNGRVKVTQQSETIELDE